MRLDKALTWIERVRDWFRASGWLLAALIGMAWLSEFAPTRLGVLVWLTTKICWGAYLGYLVDRNMFHRARPHELTGTARWVGWGRRAVIVSAAILAMALGI